MHAQVVSITIHVTCDPISLGHQLAEQKLAVLLGPDQHHSQANAAVAFSLVALVTLHNCICTSKYAASG